MLANPAVEAQFAEPSEHVVVDAQQLLQQRPPSADTVVCNAVVDALHARMTDFGAARGSIEPKLKRSAPFQWSVWQNFGMRITLAKARCFIHSPFTTLPKG